MVRASGLDEARTVSFFGRGVEGELADHESGSCEILQGEIHLSFLVIKDAHLANLSDEPSDVLGAIGLFDSEEDKEALADGGDHLAFDGDGGLGDSL